MKILCGKFSELRRHSLQLFYAIRDHPRTMLYNDEDLEVMFAVADSIGLNCIEVTVVDSRGFDSGTSWCGGDVGANSCGDVGASTSKGISFSGQVLVSRQFESMGYVGFRDALRKYSIVHSLEFDFVKNETERVTAVCKVKSCKWNIHARLDKVNGCFYIKRYYSVHSCGVAGRTTKNCHANSTLISQLIKDDVRDKSKKRPVDVVDDLKEYYRELPNELWSNVFFPGQRYGAMSSSLAECFNSWILKERELPVVDMVDRIRKKMMKSMCLRRERAMIPSSADIFEVDTDPSVSVDIGRRICSCCWWPLNGFPCCHAICAIKYSSKNLNLHVERYFHVESYRQVYSKPIYPVASLWKGDVVDCGTSILPPLSKKPPGRPKKKRICSNEEKVREMKCGRCGKLGNHNKLTCKEDLRPGF
ncbi:hypothetical protein RHSIM_Rhsim04G0107600 [Rhododendron simsii]|uniref:SWIM-type domain-containing protein n=1 Tax=Rhododendron simsii TaxID=118357 RepID=A0A834H414_RHOSS|nr:hypothetical protein RHSIM_Rhsim04G0107600 [Rhododendron simsii]